MFCTVVLAVGILGSVRLLCATEPRMLSGVGHLDQDTVQRVVIEITVGSRGEHKPELQSEAQTVSSNNVSLSLERA